MASAPRERQDAEQRMLGAVPGVPAFGRGSGWSVVFVDVAEGSSTSYGSIHRDDDGRVVVGRQLLAALVRGDF
jgi:hypothetical protein